ncbi:60S ribosomal protein L38 [Iris pallida]|uniref:60S ribosomal protein L38 n=1 Tax=Iris pallida TaxID=29817 RepID=A0AAX6GD13_IRIPA|nr:60S ribosomal protein L38 [Iris pallida]KAJ6826624.1 60S ribosomal protein L38 [Iris pallida]KAJ6830013.1 60S ribosomal protein L38 [Iris pallida]KAJ6831786.1 60S ribosomal protein L38 [Iris pallida]
MIIHVGENNILVQKFLSILFQDLLARTQISLLLSYYQLQIIFVWWRYLGLQTNIAACKLNSIKDWVDKRFTRLC